MELTKNLFNFESTQHHDHNFLVQPAGVTIIKMNHISEMALDLFLNNRTFRILHGCLYTPF